MKKIDKYAINDYRYSEKDFRKPHFVKIGPYHKHLYANKKFCYVVALIRDKEEDKRIRHEMGPFNRVAADSLMSQLLLEGHCCWVEEGPIK